MSESVAGGAAAGGLAGLGVCALLVAGAAAGVAYLVGRGLRWLSEKALEDLERLEKSVTIPAGPVTTREGRAFFKETFAAVQAKAVKIPALRPYAKPLAAALALQKSPFRAFLSPADWRALVRPRFDGKTIRQALNSASARFTAASAGAVAGTIAETAASQGFVKRREIAGQGQKILVCEDTNGRAVVAEVRETEDGVTLRLDLAGFGDGACRGTMDRILKGLAERGVTLKGAVRTPHYKREGVLAESLPGCAGKTKEGRPHVATQGVKSSSDKSAHLPYWKHQMPDKTRRLA